MERGSEMERVIHKYSLNTNREKDKNLFLGPGYGVVHMFFPVITVIANYPKTQWFKTTTILL